MNLVTAFIGADTANFQLAVAARLARMNTDNASSVAKLVDAAQQSLQPLANTAAGIGTNLDVSV